MIASHRCNLSSGFLDGPDSGACPIADIAGQFRRVRDHSTALARDLSAEDQCVQSMPDASPTKWHLAHTTWFFETLVLQHGPPGYRVFDPRFNHLFNSYYEAIGPRHPRPQRGLLTRPSSDEVQAYRAHVDRAMHDWLTTGDPVAVQALLPTIVLGLHHEQQHQELLVTDVLHAFSCNPLLPALWSTPVVDCGASVPEPDGVSRSVPAAWSDFAGGLVSVGHGAEGEAFYFDNETPRHPVWLQPYRLANGLVSCGEYAAFIADGGYRTAALWLADGWAAVQARGWSSPAYWYAEGDLPARWMDDEVHPWNVFGTQGLRPMDPDAPVAQLSFYEAAAYAEWAGGRLPTEFEWEAAYGAPALRDMTGRVWQWTRSSYDPYPGFRPLPGLAAEYNGKFMVGQVVLRGSSIATPDGHVRPTYRNFFPPAARWQFSGLRLAKDL